MVDIKKSYKILLSVVLLEFLILLIVNKMNITVRSWIGNALGAAICLLPIQVLLFLMSNNEKLTDNKRKCLKLVFWFINICYVLGGIATL